MNAGVLLGSPFIRSGAPNAKVVSPTFRVSLPSSAPLLWKHPHRQHAQGFHFWMIPNPVKIALKTVSNSEYTVSDTNRLSGVYRMDVDHGWQFGYAKGGL